MKKITLLLCMIIVIISYFKPNLCNGGVAHRSEYEKFKWPNNTVYYYFGKKDNFQTFCDLFRSFFNFELSDLEEFTDEEKQNIEDAMRKHTESYNPTLTVNPQN